MQTNTISYRLGYFGKNGWGLWNKCGRCWQTTLACSTTGLVLKIFTWNIFSIFLFKPGHFVVLTEILNTFKHWCIKSVDAFCTKSLHEIRRNLTSVEYFGSWRDKNKISFSQICTNLLTQKLIKPLETKLDVPVSLKMRMFTKPYRMCVSQDAVKFPNSISQRLKVLTILVGHKVCV